MDNSSATGVRAVGRALEILAAFREGDHELSASELLSRVKLSRPTLYRLLYTLENEGFIRAVGEPQRFALGPAVGQLSRVWASNKQDSPDLPVLAQPMMKQLWQDTGETVALQVLDGIDRVCIAELPSSEALSFRRGVGHRESIMLGASGRAILAHLAHTPTTLRKYAKGLPKGHAQDLDAFSAELDRTRRRGWAVSHSELIKGAVAIAAPFFDGTGQVAGSLAVFGPSARIDATREQLLVELVAGHAAAITGALGRGQR